MRGKTSAKRIAALLAGACFALGGCTPSTPAGGEHVHDWQVTSTTEATCTEGGMTYYACSGCEETKQEPIAAKGHNWELKEKVEPTCLEGGYTEYTCGECGASKREDEEDAKGHDFKAEVTQESTCQSVEITTYSCKNCTFSYTEKTKDTSAHSWLESDHADGVYTCSVCGIREIRYEEPIHSGETVTGAINSGATVSYRETTFTVKAEKNGIYTLWLDFSAETYIGTLAIFNETIADGAANALFTDGKAITSDHSVGSDVEGATGYNKNSYTVYLQAGENEMKLMTAAGTANVGDAGEVTLSGVRIGLVEETEALALFENTHARNLLTYGVGYGPYLICGSGQTVVASTATLSVAEDGLYTFGYFGAGANNGHAAASEIYFTFTREEDGVLHRITMRSDGLPAKTDFGYLNDLYTYTGTEKAEDVHVYKGSYDCYTGGTKGGQNVYLTAGDWTVTVGAYDHTGDSKAFVLFGCGLFAKKAEGAHEHSYTHTSSVPASCTQTGEETYSCTGCGDTYSEVSYGHSYSDHTIAAGDRGVCDICGVQEYNFEPLAKSAAKTYDVNNSTGKYYTETFTVKADKAGVYKLNLRYTVERSESAADVDISNFYAGVVNKTLNEALEAEDGQGMQSFNLLTKDASVPAAYAGAAGGYNASCFSVYLTGGDNILELHFSDCTDVTVTGARLEAESLTDLYLYTWYYTQAHWTGAYFTSGKSTLGLSVNMMANGSWNETRGGTLTIAEEGWYDSSVLVTAANNTEIKLTLTNGAQTIELNSKGLSAAAESSLSTTRLSRNLFDADGEHLVYLTAGDWTVSLQAVNADTSKRIAFSGGGIFFESTGETCEHHYEDQDVVSPTCESAGSKKQVCTECGAVKNTVLPATGHSYKSETLTDGSLTCTVCGTKEYRFANAPANNKQAGVCLTSFKVEIPAEKSGLYRVYLDYAYVRQETTEKKDDADVGALINKTMYPDYYQTSAMMSNMKGFIQSYNIIDTDASLAYGYSGGDGGYNANYFNVYLEGGKEQELVMHTQYLVNAEYSFTLRGVKLVLVAQPEGIVVTSHDGRTHTASYFGQNLGFNVNLISNSNNNVISEEQSQTVTLTGGVYDITFLASAYKDHTDNELKITLVKGDKTIVLTSQKICQQDVSSCGKPHGKMLLSDNLVDENGTHLVELEAGEWTVKVHCTKTTANYRALLFGGAFLTKVSD